MSPKRCDRADDVARLEWMDAAETRAFSAHIDECSDCARAKEILDRSTSMLRGMTRELTPDARVALREAVDDRVEREFRPRSVWLPISITASAAVLAIALWVRLSERSAEHAAPAAAAVVAVAQEQAPVAVAREPAMLRAGSRVPIAGGTLAIERDSTIALALDGSATGVKLIEGSIQLEVSGELLFVVDTPKAEVRASAGSVRVIADRDALRVDVLAGAAEVHARSGDREEVRLVRAGESVRVPAVVEVAAAVERAPVVRPKKRDRVVAQAPVREPQVEREEITKPQQTPEIPREPEITREPEIPEIQQQQQPQIRPREYDAAELIAQADRARRAGNLSAASALYRRVSEMPGPLAEEANYLWADTLSRAGENQRALEALRSFGGTTRLSPERTALRARLLLSMDRIKDAAIALEDARASSVELQSARLAVAKAALDDHPALAQELIEPLLHPAISHTLQVKATRIAILAARAQGDRQKEEGWREKLLRLEQQEENSAGSN